MNADEIQVKNINVKDSSSIPLEGCATEAKEEQREIKMKSNAAWLEQALFLSACIRIYLRFNI